MATAVEFQPVLLADPEVEIIANPVGLNNYFLMRKIHLRRFDFIFHLLIEMNNNKKKIVARISLCLSLPPPLYPLFPHVLSISVDKERMGKDIDLGPFADGEI